MSEGARERIVEIAGIRHQIASNTGIKISQWILLAMARPTDVGQVFSREVRNGVELLRIEFSGIRFLSHSDYEASYGGGVGTASKLAWPVYAGSKLAKLRAQILFVNIKH
jgi:hypothetical protein